MLQKKSGLTYEEVRERYEHFRSRCKPAKKGSHKVVPIMTKKAGTSIKKKEKGCTEPLHGKKAKCVIQIVPQEQKTQTFYVKSQCLKTRRHPRQRQRS